MAAKQKNTEAAIAAQAAASAAAVQIPSLTSDVSQNDEKEEKVTFLERAAVVITAIGKENAAEVYKHLTDDEVEKLTYEVARAKFIDVTRINGILNEFYELCLTQKVITEGGVDYARRQRGDPCGGCHRAQLRCRSHRPHLHRRRFHHSHLCQLR